MITAEMTTQHNTNLFASQRFPENKKETICNQTRAQPYTDRKR